MRICNVVKLKKLIFNIMSLEEVILKDTGSLRTHNIPSSRSSLLPLFPFSTLSRQVISNRTLRRCIVEHVLATIFPLLCDPSWPHLIRSIAHRSTTVGSDAITC